MQSSDLQPLQAFGLTTFDFLTGADACFTGIPLPVRTCDGAEQVIVRAEDIEADNR